MGLAASQARFLAITARKANCEFQSMQIAQQKLSITRDLEAATAEYQSALNTTKLVWDPDGTGDNTFDLTYDIMMRPSAVNNYAPYFITARDGKIVLDSKMAAAAEAAGIPKDGCNPSEELFQKFLNQMVRTGGMSESDAASCRAVGLLENVGMGAPMLDKTTASEMNTTDLIAYLDLLIANTTEASSQADKDLVDALTFNFGKDDEGNELTKPDGSPIGLNLQTGLDNKGDANQNYFVVNGSRTTDTEFDLTDLLTSDITFAMTGDKVKASFWQKLGAGILSVFTAGFAYNGILNWINDNKSIVDLDKATAQEVALVYFLNDLFNGLGELFNMDEADETKSQAFSYAVQQTMGLLNSNMNLGSRSHSVDAFNDAVNASDDYNGWVSKAATSNKNYGTTAISLSNLTESFLTYFAQGINGYDQTYYIVQNGNKSNYVTDDPYYMWQIGDPNAETTTDMYLAEFYSSMFNNLCNSGWTENDQITDKEFLSNSLLNAQYFISSMSSDNYYFQDRYTDNGYVVEVTDDDAITQAELAYTIKKSKLNSKEEKLDIDMQKLDLEISALTTEYDTVKQLINNNVEKTFTMFSS